MFSSVSNMSGALTQHITPPPPQFTITGASKSSVTGYNVYTFTSTTRSGSITFKCNTNVTIQALVCAGGGGGSSAGNMGGAGGAGGMISQAVILPLTDTITITVGTGGAGGETYVRTMSGPDTQKCNGYNGNNSQVIFTNNVLQNLTAIGGGFGTFAGSGNDGGSGGGGSSGGGGGQRTLGQGNRGAGALRFYTSTSTLQDGGGGGGGAGSKGGEYISETAQLGSSAGLGLTCSLPGIQLVTGSALFCAGGKGEYVTSDPATINSGNGGNAGTNRDSNMGSATTSPVKMYPGAAGASGVVYIAIPTTYTQSWSA